MGHPRTILLSWVLLRRESRGDSTSRPWNFGDVEFPQEARVTPVELSINSAVSLLLNLGATQQERSVRFLDEQKLQFKGSKKGFVKNTNLGFMRCYVNLE